MRRRAETDPLTGLLHRSAFEAALRHAVAGGGAPQGQQTAVLALDLDGLREGDQLFRLGGDEFATVLVVRDEQEAVLATWEPTTTQHDLLADADAALYRAKAAGRNAMRSVEPAGAVPAATLP